MVARKVDGIFLLDKPVSMTSNGALQAVKRLYQASKAGHTGSLDPLASGLLPICLGEATKISGFLLGADKRYRFSCRLGVTTRTGDAEGEVLLRRPVGTLNKRAVETVLQRFVGQIEQLPPMYSALKHRGQRLYKLARKGVEVERQPRKVTIHELGLLEMEGGHLQCQAKCSKGTYVRTLAEDIGEALGCGAHITELRRVGVEPYDTSQMITLDALQEQAARGLAVVDALLLPADTALTVWPAVCVNRDTAHYLRMGQPVIVAHAPTQGRVRLYEGEEHFFGLGEILDDGRVAPRRLIQSE